MDALVTVNQNYAGQYCANVLGFSNMEDNLPFMEDFVNELSGWWKSTTQIHRATNWTFLDCTISFIVGPIITFSYDVAAPGGQWSGLAAANPMPNTDCLLMSLQHLGVAPNRGRIYYAGLNEAAHDASVWSSPVLDDFETLTQAMVDGIGTLATQAFLRIVGRPSPTRVNYVSTPVDSIVPRSIVATQRRRRISV